MYFKPSSMLPPKILKCLDVTIGEDTVRVACNTYSHLYFLTRGFKKATSPCSLIMSSYATKTLYRVLFAESSFSHSDLLNLIFCTQEQCPIFYPCYIFFLVRSDMLLSLGIFWIWILSSVIFLNILVSTANIPCLLLVPLREPLIKTFNQKGSRTDPQDISLSGWY